MAIAEIIAIGSELLLGETQDTNTSFILRELRNIGVNVYRTLMIGDNPARISAVIREAFTRANIVITTGGLGPTVDDPTREATAMAFDCPVEYREQEWQRIAEYFLKLGRKLPSDNNKRQAFFPTFATVIPNPVGTAPAYYIHQDEKLLISLPGVPSEMRFLLMNEVIPLIRNIYPSESTMLVKTLHTFGMGESVVDEMVSELEKSTNPTLGLSAKQGITDLRITAFGEDYDDAAQKLRQFEMAIRNILGNNIYGEDDDTLEQIVNDLLAKNNIQLDIYQFGVKNPLASLFKAEFLREIRQDPWEFFEDRTIEGITRHFEQQKTLDFPTLVAIRESADKDFTEISLIFSFNNQLHRSSRKFNSRIFSDDYISLAALDLIRNSIQN